MKSKLARINGVIFSAFSALVVVCGLYLAAPLAAQPNATQIAATNAAGDPLSVYRFPAGTAPQPTVTIGAVATNTWETLTPNWVAWKAGNKWYREQVNEPPGAVLKQVDYSIDPDAIVRIVRPHEVAGKILTLNGQPLLLYSPELRGRDLGTPITNAALGTVTVNRQLTIPTEDRAREYWIEIRK